MISLVASSNKACGPLILRFFIAPSLEMVNKTLTRPSMFIFTASGGYTKWVRICAIIFSLKQAFLSFASSQPGNTGTSSSTENGIASVWLEVLLSFSCANMLLTEKINKRQSSGLNVDPLIKFKVCDSVFILVILGQIIS